MGPAVDALKADLDKARQAAKVPPLSIQIAAENTVKSKLPAYKTWRKSPNTSCTDGVGPSRQTILSEKREGKRTSSRTGQHRTSLPEPCCMHPTLQDLQHSPHFSGSQAPQEVGCSSPGKTTKRALPLSPTSSGCWASLRRLATMRHAPLTVAALGLASPSRVSGQTSVVSTASCAEATCPPRLPASLCRRCSLVILDGPGAAPFLRICPDQNRNQRLACAPSNLEGTLMRGTGGRRSELVFFFFREREAGNITKECEGQKLRHNQTKNCLMQITPPRRACGRQSHMMSDLDGVGPSVPGLPRLSRSEMLELSRQHKREWTPNGSAKIAEREHG